MQEHTGMSASIQPSSFACILSRDVAGWGAFGRGQKPVVILRAPPPFCNASAISAFLSNFAPSRVRRRSATRRYHNGLTFAGTAAPKSKTAPAPPHPPPKYTPATVPNNSTTTRAASPADTCSSSGRQALDGGGRKAAQVLGVRRAEIALGVHMHAHRRGHFGPEMLRQPGMPEVFMPRVDTHIRDILRHVMQEVADVVQQRRDHQPVRSTVARRTIRRLQRVFQLRDRLAKIRRAAFGLEDFDDSIGDLHTDYAPCVTAARRWPIKSSAAAPQIGRASWRE